MSTHQPQVKIIGTNGQVSLGKEYSGKTVIINQIDQGTWMIKTGVFVPDDEKWLYEGKNLAKLERALEWAEQNKPKDNFDEFVQGLEDEQHKN